MNKQNIIVLLLALFLYSNHIEAKSKNLDHFLGVRLLSSPEDVLKKLDIRTDYRKVSTSKKCTTKFLVKDHTEYKKYPLQNRDPDYKRNCFLVLSKEEKKIFKAVYLKFREINGKYLLYGVEGQFHGNVANSAINEWVKEHYGTNEERIDTKELSFIFYTRVKSAKRFYIKTKYFENMEYTLDRQKIKKAASYALGPGGVDQILGLIINKDTFNKNRLHSSYKLNSKDPFKIKYYSGYHCGRVVWRNYKKNGYRKDSGRDVSNYCSKMKKYKGYDSFLIATDFSKKGDLFEKGFFYSLLTKGQLNEKITGYKLEFNKFTSGANVKIEDIKTKLVEKFGTGFKTFSTIADPDQVDIPKKDDLNIRVNGSYMETRWNIGDYKIRLMSKNHDLNSKEIEVLKSGVKKLPKKGSQLITLILEHKRLQKDVDDTIKWHMNNKKR